MPATRKRKKKFRPVLENLGSMITYKDEAGDDCCLGYLMDFHERGVFDATWGKVDVTPEQCKTHNELYDKAHVEGLDERCEVGQGGHFYTHGVFGDPARPLAVKTFVGTVIATGPDIKSCSTDRGRGLVLTFERKGKLFRGRWKPIDGDLTFYERIK